jgi:hypothetical protein
MGKPEDESFNAHARYFSTSQQIEEASPTPLDVNM